MQSIGATQTTTPLRTLRGWSLRPPSPSEVGVNPPSDALCSPAFLREPGLLAPKPTSGLKVFSEFCAQLPARPHTWLEATPQGHAGAECGAARTGVRGAFFNT